MRLSLALIFCLVAATGFMTKPKSPKLIWSDEFEYTGLPDSTKWSYDLGTGPPEDWGNQELEYYTRNAKNARVENGKLIIEAHQEPLGGKNFTSARLVTRGKADWKNVRIDIRAKVASGKGAWSAIWMMPVVKQYGEWPACGEIDIMEHVGKDLDKMFWSAHSKKLNWTLGTQQTYSTYINGITNDFHVFKLDWSKESLKFYVDDVLYYTANNDGRGTDYYPFVDPQFLLLNLAIGGNLAGNTIDDTIFPVRMEVDYVRVYQ